MQSLSIVIPAKNESAGLSKILPIIRETFPAAEVIIVDDCSDDDAGEISRTHGAKVLRRPYSMGNGAAVKAGAREAKGETIVFLDGDGQHDPNDIPRLLEKMSEGYHMVVGARTNSSQANYGRLLANGLYNRLATWMTGHLIPDLTSGFRAVKAHQFREFLHMLPNGFSYPTTITMAFFRSGYPVGYIPIHASKRSGRSHIRPIRDGVRFLLIIFRIGTLYSPLKLFFPISVALFTVGLIYYGYTLFSLGRFTNMSALLFSTSVIVFLIGLVSEQITNLLYTHRN